MSDLTQKVLYFLLVMAAVFSVEKNEDLGSETYMILILRLFQWPWDLKVQNILELKYLGNQEYALSIFLSP